MLACQKLYLDVVNRLVQLGAEVDHADKDGCTALICACSNGHLDVVQLVQLGADVHQQCQDDTGEHSWSSLMAASEGGHLPVVVRLAQLGAAVDHTAETGSTALSLACQNGHLDIVDWVLSTLKTPGIYHCTAMMRAIKGRHFNVVARLLAAVCGCRFLA